MPFGLAGLGAAWQAAGKLLSIPPVVSDALFILAAAVWVALVAGYLAQGPAQLLSDWHDGALYLPTVAGGFVGAYCAAAVHLHMVAEASFGIGIFCWMLVAALVLNRLMFRPALPPPLVPTLAIQLAPPVVAGLAYFGISGSKIDYVGAALGGYAVLMALVQLRLVPLYARLSEEPEAV